MTAKANQSEDTVSIKKEDPGKNTARFVFDRLLFFPAEEHEMFYIWSESSDRVPTANQIAINKDMARDTRVWFRHVRNVLFVQLLRGEALGMIFSFWRGRWGGAGGRNEGISRNSQANKKGRSLCGQTH